jgi:hypothetical protein
MYDPVAEPNMDFKMLTEIFYRMAPIHLVLERISGYPIEFGEFKISPSFGSYFEINEFGSASV